jgi:N-acetylmuramoyl-L-alanine amidase
MTRVAIAAAALACGLAVASCAPSTTQARPPSSSETAASSSPAPSGPPVTVPGLSSEAPSPTAESSTVPPTTEPPAPEPTTQESTPEPPPAPEPAEPPQVDDPADDFVQTEEPAAPAPAPAPAQITGGKVVVIDPGHNGANGANPGVINSLVDAGFGETKPCNTTGTSTNDGYPEHDFTWAVANDLKPMLEAQGITVIMTRDSDDGVGPCVDKRAAIGNNANADAVVSIHGDGVQSESDTGFYVMTAVRDPAGAAMSAQSDELARSMRDGLVSAGLAPSNYLGTDGLWDRDDLAGLNLSTRPTVMIESGNMRASSDAALMSSAAGQQKFAQGYANGILNYLASR